MREPDPFFLTHYPVAYFFCVPFPVRLLPAIRSAFSHEDGDRVGPLSSHGAPKDRIWILSLFATDPLDFRHPSAPVCCVSILDEDHPKDARLTQFCGHFFHVFDLDLQPAEVVETFPLDMVHPTLPPPFFPSRVC